MGGDGGGSLFSPDGVAPNQMVGVHASVIFPCTIKVQKKIFFFWNRLIRVVPKGPKTGVAMCVARSTKQSKQISFSRVSSKGIVKSKPFLSPRSDGI